MTTADERIGKVEGRVSRLEGAYEHLATKADVATLKGWIAGAAAVVSLAVVLVQVLG